MNSALVNKIKKIVELEELVLYDIRFTKFDNNDIFEVIIDNESSNIDMNVIEKISRPISNLVNEYEKEMPESYYLQVISPGPKRKLLEIKHYELSLGKKISIKYHNGTKTVKVEGKLLKTKPITLSVNDEEIIIQLETIKEGKWV